MKFDEYQELALKTFNKDKEKDMTLIGVMGLSGESGECLDLMKKHLFHGHELDKNKLTDELGDVLWYLAITAKSIGVSLEEVASFNVNKLKTRYPKGFSTKDSIARVDYNKKTSV